MVNRIQAGRRGFVGNVMVEVS